MECYDMRYKQKVNVSNLFLEKFAEAQKFRVGSPEFDVKDNLFFYINSILTLPLEPSRFELVQKDYRADNQELADYVKHQSTNDAKARVLVHNGDYNVLMSSVFHVLKQKEGRGLKGGFPKEYYVEKAQEDYKFASGFERTSRDDDGKRVKSNLNLLYTNLPLIVEIVEQIVSQLAGLQPKISERRLDFLVDRLVGEADVDRTVKEVEANIVSIDDPKKRYDKLLDEFLTVYGNYEKDVSNVNLRLELMKRAGDLKSLNPNFRFSFDK